MPPKVFEPFIGWYLTRIYIHVRPERIYVWGDGDPSREPRLFDAHMEEVRSGHDEEPDADHADTAGGARWPGTSEWRSWAPATRRRR